MGNNYFGFSPEGFEQFARAMAVSIIGPGVTTFGNGPDGGREATFRGEVPYPFPPTKQWSGYGVVQAKCKERPESAEKDQKWALKELRKELKSFVSSPNREPKPQYYIFVTNVDLSSVSGGGKDQAYNLVQSYYSSLPLLGHAIWDANQLSSLLDTRSEIRKRFLAYLTTGDVLGAMLEVIAEARPDAARVLGAFVERELRADEAARLDQAGNRTEEQLKLARLFFDLPTSKSPELLQPVENVQSDGRLPPGVLVDLLRDGSRKLDPKTIYEQESAQTSGEDSLPTRYVLLGGPGSGKSTVGQFLAQIHRAGLLSRRPQHLLEPEARQIIRETEALCEQEGIGWPKTPRYPFRVDLNRFAKALASTGSEQVKSLEGYLLTVLRREFAVTHEDLLRWLETYPWLLILDGLDEVPPSSNRGAVVDAVNAFLAQARQVEADIFVVATSREQGYHGEFASGVTFIRYVKPLSRDRALRYVEKYATARFGAGSDRARELMQRLHQSTKRELTSQLMNSPLQVTFMCTVVAASGDPGENRWQLFDSYYRTIYDRERQKAVPPYDSVLSKQQATIDRLHHDIGFWLQYRSEIEKGAPVSLTIKEFECLVDRYLDELGRDGEDKEKLVKLITDAARHRLVFLASRVEGELSFDVRSLQEYMAAECLMTGEHESVKLRLKAIAHAPYWRNVFLFAASKCFADAQSRHFQDRIRILCEDLNAASSPLLARTKAGSELALDILQSGAVAENPNYARHLARLGLELIAEPYVSAGPRESAAPGQRLGAVYSDLLRSVYVDQLGLRVGQSSVDRATGAWSLLTQLIDRNVSWAREIGEMQWPTDGNEQLRILESLPIQLVRTPWVNEKSFETVSAVGLAQSKKLLSSFRRHGRAEADPTSPLAMLLRALHLQQNEQPDELKVRGINGLSIGYTPTFSRSYSETSDAVSGLKLSHPTWAPLLLAGEFLRGPDQTSLANIIDRCQTAGWTTCQLGDLLVLPWPLAACLARVMEGTTLSDMAEQVRDGSLGDSESWQRAEDDWRVNGIPFELLVLLEKRTIPMTPSEALAPKVGSWSVMHHEYPPEAVTHLFQLAEDCPPSRLKNTLVAMFFAIASIDGKLSEKVSAPNLRRLLHNCEMPWWENDIGFPADGETLDQWLDLYDFIGRSMTLPAGYIIANSNEEVAKWSAAMQSAYVSSASCYETAHNNIRDPRKLGLLRVLGRLGAAGSQIDHIPESMLETDLFPDGRFRLAAILISLSRQSLTDQRAVSLADESAVLMEADTAEDTPQLVFRTVSAHLQGNSALRAFILRLHEKIPPCVDRGTAQCESLLRRLASQESSDLQREAQLGFLDLPIIDRDDLTRGL